MKINTNYRLTAARNQTANNKTVALINSILGTNFKPDIYNVDGAPNFTNPQYCIVNDLPNAIHSKILKIISRLDTEADDGYYGEYPIGERFCIDYWSYVISAVKSKDVPGTIIILEIYATGLTKAQQFDYEE